MKTGIRNLFTAHPQSVDEGYFEHMVFAAKFSFKLFVAGFAACIHAFLPFMFEKTAGNMIKELYGRIDNRQT